MSFDDYSPPVTSRRISLTESVQSEPTVQQQRREGLTGKLRQTFTPAGRGVHSAPDQNIPSSKFQNLSHENQELVLRAVDLMKQQDSENIMSTLDESRDMLSNAFEEFKREQDEYRRQLIEITQSKEAAMQRRKENAIPLSIFMRQKRDVEGLADLRPNSSMNPKYQAHFEALLAPESTSTIGTAQHPSDKAAVVKYIRRRERRRRAEENRKNYEMTDDVLEKQTAEVMQKLEGMDVKMEQERQRQNELLRARMQEKKVKSKTMMEASEIMGQANEADLARQRVEQSQREKIEARLSAVRRTQNRTVTPSNEIHVHGRNSDDDDDDSYTLNEEQEATTKSSLQLLNDSGDHRHMRATTPVYGDADADEKIPHIQI